MAQTIEFRGEGAQLAVEVLGYENPAATNLWDAEWLSCRVSASIPGFEGHIEASLTTRDFERLLTELREALTRMSGSASLVTDEEQLRVRIDIRGAGAAEISGEVTSVGRPKGSLIFSFDSDQTYLLQILEVTERVVTMFPSRSSALRPVDPGADRPE
jgi:hypothetical protein